MSGFGDQRSDTVVHVVNIESGSDLATLSTDPALGIYDFTISPDGTQILTGDNDANVKVSLWDLAMETELVQYPVGENYIIDFSPDGTLFATAFFDGGVKQLETDTGREVLKLSDYGDQVEAVRFGP